MFKDYKKHATYLCKTEEEYFLLYDYMEQICGFRPLTPKNNLYFYLYPAYTVTIQDGDYDTLVSTVPKYPPAFDYNYNTVICNTLNQFMEFLDQHNRIWDKKN